MAEPEIGSFEYELVSALNRIATHLKYLGNGNAATEVGALEAHGKAINEGLIAVAESISSLALEVGSLHEQFTTQEG